MSRPIAALAALALASCGTWGGALDEIDSALVVDVSASLTAEPYTSRLRGTVVVELSLPEGEPSREIALEWLHVGGNFLRVDQIDGLRAFPSRLAGGERARVELGVAIDAFERGPHDDFVFADPTCELEELVVEASVIDAEATHLGSAVSGRTEAVVEVVAAPTPIAAARVIDLGVEAHLVAADPDTDGDLLIAVGARVERVAPDGSRRWSADLPGEVLAVGRGGGADVAAARGSLDGLPCDPDPVATSTLERTFAARLDDGVVTWCVPLLVVAPRLAVDDRGRVAVADISFGERVHLIAPDGSPQTPFELAVRPRDVVAVGDTFVVLARESSENESWVGDVRPFGAELHAIAGDVAQIAARRDGTVGVLSYEPSWIVFDPRADAITDRTRLPSGVLGLFTLAVEPREGEVLRVGSVRAGIDRDAALVAELGTGPLARWRGTLTCGDASSTEVRGSDGEALLALTTEHLVLGGVELAPPGLRRTIVVELVAP